MSKAEIKEKMISLLNKNEDIDIETYDNVLADIRNDNFPPFPGDKDE